MRNDSGEITTYLEKIKWIIWDPFAQNFTNIFFSKFHKYFKHLEEMDDFYENYRDSYICIYILIYQHKYIYNLQRENMMKEIQKDDNEIAFK